MRTMRLLLPFIAATASGQVAPQSAPSRLVAGDSLLARGYVVAADSAFTDAVRAARAAADRRALAAAYAGLALARARTVGDRAAVATLDSIEAVAAVTEPALAARVLCARAAVEARAARPNALALADSGLALAKRVGADALIPGCRFAAAWHQSRFEMGRSMAEIAQVDTLVRRSGDRASYATARWWRVWVNAALGYGDAAAGYAGDALAEAQASGNIGAEGGTLLELAKLAYRSGDDEKAQDYLLRAETLLALGGDADALGGVRRERAAWAVNAGDLRTAGRDLDTERRRDDASGDFEARRVVLGQLASLALREGRYGASDSALADLEALVRAHAPLWGAAAANLRTLFALRAGDARAAVALVERTMAGRAPAQLLYRSEDLSMLALARLRLGDTARSLRLLAEATDSLDVYRASTSTPLLRVLIYQTRRQFGGDPGIVASIVAAGAAAGHTAEAFDHAERRRARALLDALLDVDRPRADSVVPSRTQVVREPSLDSARMRRGERDPTVGPRAWSVRRVSPREIVARLPTPRTALLEFSTGGGGAPTTLFVVSRRGTRAYLLAPEDSLRPLVERLNALAEDGADVTVAARALGTAMFGTSLADLPSDVDRIVVVPDGALHRAPLALLDAGGGPLGIHYALSVAPSATIAVTLWERHRRSGAARVLAFGDPTYGSATEAPFASLPASADEARRAAALAPHSRLLLGDQATAVALRHAPLDSFGVVHLATHVLVDGVHPGGSSLVLAPAGDDSGLMSGNALGALPFADALVVLSACRSIDGPVLAGEGIQGLTSPLLSAGARAVIATHWDLPDRGALRAMTLFYDALGRGMATDQALGHMRRELRRMGAPAREWGGFVLVGDGSQPVVAAPRRHRFGWLTPWR